MEQRTKVVLGGIGCALFALLLFSSVSGGDEEKMDLKIMRERLRSYEQLLKQKQDLLNEKLKAGADADVEQINARLAEKEAEIDQLQNELEEAHEQEQQVEEQLEKALQDKENSSDDEDEKEVVAEVVSEAERKMALDKGSRDGIPKLGHFIHLKNEAFDVFAYISVRSAIRFLKADKIYIHYDDVPPTGSWFDKISKKVTLKELNDTDMEDFDEFAEFGQLGQKPPAFMRAMSARGRKNVLKLQVLADYGGVVMDYNNVILKDFSEVYKLKQSIVVGDRANGDIGIEVIVSRKGHQLWKDVLLKSKELLPNNKPVVRINQRVLTHVIKLYSAQAKTKEDVLILPPGDFYALDRVKFGKILSDDKDVVKELPEDAMVLHLFPLNPRLQISAADIRLRRNAITSTLYNFLDEADLKELPQQDDVDRDPFGEGEPKEANPLDKITHSRANFKSPFARPGVGPKLPVLGRPTKDVQSKKGKFKAAPVQEAEEQAEEQKEEVQGDERREEEPAEQKQADKSAEQEEQMVDEMVKQASKHMSKAGKHVNKLGSKLTSKQAEAKGKVSKLFSKLSRKRKLRTKKPVSRPQEDE